MNDDYNNLKVETKQKNVFDMIIMMVCITMSYLNDNHFSKKKIVLKSL